MNNITKEDNPIVVNLTLFEAKKTYAKLTVEDQQTFAQWVKEQAHNGMKI